MTIQDVLDEASGKRLSDIVSECRQAMIVRREDGVLAIGDLARLILAQIA